MTKLIISASVIILWLHSLLSSILHLYLDPLRVDGGFFLYAPFVLLIPIALIYFLRSNVNYITSPTERWRKDEDFDQRIIEIEAKYKNDINGLKRKAVLLALFGYAIVLGLISFILGLGFAAAWIVTLYFNVGYYSLILVTPNIWIVYKLIKALKMGSYGNQGIEVSKKEAPKLFTLLKKIQKKADGPKFKRVFIDMELNASVSRSTGFLGSIGFGNITLNLGLPLMQCLDVNQLAGVIAHEYGHVAAKDNALAHWVYRIRNTWIELDDIFNKEKIWVLFLGGLYNWFIDLFLSYSFVLSRYCEYEADRFSSSVAGSKNISEALVLMNFVSDNLNSGYWSEIWDRAKYSPKPHASPYAHMREAIAKLEIKEDDIKRVLEVETNNKSTHPSVQNRIKNVEQNIYELAVPEEPSSTLLLGEGLENSFMFLFDKAWRNYISAKWSGEYNRYQHAKAELDELNTYKYSTLPMDKLNEVLKHSYVVGDDESIIHACKEMLRRDENNISALVHMYGHSLMHEGNTQNLLKLDEVVRAHPEYIGIASEFAIKYFEKNRWYKEAKVYRYRLEDWEYKNAAASDERNYIYDNDVIKSHNMPWEYLRIIISILESERGIKKAWMVSKEIEYFKSIPFFPIILKKSLFSFKSRKKIQKNIEEMIKDQGLNSYCRCFWLSDVNLSAFRLNRIPGAVIYRKR